MDDSQIRTTTDEKMMLSVFRQQGQDAMLALCDGLSDEQLRQGLVPSMTTILGMVKHLVYAERWWFQDVFEGHACDYPYSEGDWDADFRIEPGESTTEILELYRTECARSSEIIERHQLDDISVNQSQRPACTLRWTILHMIEETARHAGHADILREQLDGSTGLGAP